MKARGFVIHVALTSTLSRVPGDARTAVLGAVYARVMGLTDYALPKRFEGYQYLVDGIVEETIALCGETPAKKPAKRPPMTGAERMAKLRARRALAEDCDESDESDGVTKRDEQVSKEVSKEVIESTLVTFVTPDDVRIAAHNLGIPYDFALGYFLPEMEKLGWQARGPKGDMFPVKKSNLASILRGWWNAEQKKILPRPSSDNPGSSLPAIVGYELIS
jgi:hypothetical protein